MFNPVEEIVVSPPADQSAYLAVDVTQLVAVEQWTKALGVTEAELRLAVAEVGTSAAEVRTHLGVQ